MLKSHRGAAVLLLADRRIEGRLSLAGDVVVDLSPLLSAKLLRQGVALPAHSADDEIRAVSLALATGNTLTFRQRTVAANILQMSRSLLQTATFDDRP